MNTPEKQPRLYALDAMRGFCALALMVYHYYTYNGSDYFQIGYFGVYIFFILSGFSMWYVYAGKPLSIGLLRHFFVARFARIVPLYIVVSLLAVAARMYDQGAASVTGAGFIQRFILNVTMLFGLATPGKASIVPGGWSIGIEWVFYLVFPLFLLFSRRLSSMLALLTASLMLNQLIVYGLLKDSVMAAEWNNYTHFPTFLVYFVAGISIAMLYGRLQQQGGNGYRLPFPDAAWLCRIVPLGAMAMIFLYPSATPEEYLKGGHVVLLLGVAMLAVFFGSLLRPLPLERRIYSFLGDISYSTYLINFFVYHVVDAVLKRLWPGHTVEVTIAFSIPATIALAYASYRYFEMPARVWINRRLAGSSPTYQDTLPFPTQTPAQDNGSTHRP